MKNSKTLYQVDGFRIIEVDDCDSRLDDLKGDCFNPGANPSLDADQLRRDELAFEEKVESEGTYGYVLEGWNPEVDQGWEHLDSCFGFVGAFHAHDNRHYIFDELKETLAMKLQAKENFKQKEQKIMKNLFQVNYNNCIYEIQLLDNAHACLRYLGEYPTGFTCPLHIQQFEPGLLTAIQAAGHVTDHANRRINMQYFKYNQEEQK